MNNEKKVLGVSTLAVIALIVIMVGATYAYFKGVDAQNTDTPLEVTTNTVDSLIFNIDADITLVADMSNFTEGLDNRVGEAHATATLKANNKTNSAIGNYYLYFDIKENGLSYTTEESTPELLLQVSGPDGEVTEVSGLEYVTVIDGQGKTVSGFDITEVKDLITIVSNKEITTTSTTVDDWDVKVVLVNLDADQSANGGKKFTGELIIQKNIIGGMIKSVSSDYNEEIWQYRSQISEIVFETKLNNHDGYAYKFDISAEDSDNPVMAYMMDNGDDTYTVYIQSKGMIFANSDSSYLFLGFSSLESIEDLENLDTSQVSNMNSMFKGCSKLVNLKVKLLDVSKVSNLSWIFQGCSSLKSLDVSNWETSNVTDMSYMFGGCSSLTSLNVKGIDTSQVVSMKAMFSGCSSLTTLDVSDFDTSKVTDMSHMFNICQKVLSLNISGWDTSQVTTMLAMFSQCESITSFNLNSWDTQNVENMGSVFAYCISLTSLQIDAWKTQNVTNMGSMFSGCNKLSSLNLGSWNTSRVTDMHQMFRDCGIKSLDLRCAVFTNVTSFANMFAYTTSITVYVKDESARSFIQTRLNDPNASGVAIVV